MGAFRKAIANASEKQREIIEDAGAHLSALRRGREAGRPGWGKAAGAKEDARPWASRGLFVGMGAAAVACAAVLFYLAMPFGGKERRAAPGGRLWDSRENPSEQAKDCQAVTNENRLPMEKDLDEIKALYEAAARMDCIGEIRSQGRSVSCGRKVREAMLLCVATT